MAERSDPWPTLTWVGILCGITLGAVLVLLFRRDRSDSPLALSPPRDDLDFDLEPLRRRPGPPPRALVPARTVPVARTLTIGVTKPTLLLKAVGDRDWTVWVRTLSPAGSVATFSIGHDAGNAIDLPSGGFQQMRIPRGEFLYARGNLAGVRISVSGGAD